LAAAGLSRSCAHAGFHFPPPEPDPNYPYHQQQAPQQWPPQQPPAPGGYDLGSYMPTGAQPYGQQPAQPNAYGAQFGQPQQQDYPEQDGTYGEDYLDEAEEDEPRRGRRWLFVVAALVGAIGVGGAMAYTYKSFVAPNGRVPVVKAGDPNVKVRPDNRTERKMPVRIVDEPTRPTPASAEERPADDNGPRRVRTIPIVPGATPQQAEPEAAPAPQQFSGMPGIMLDAPRRPPPPQPPPSAAQEPPSRVVIGRPPVAQPPPSAAVEDPPVARKPVQVAAPAVARPSPPPVVAAPSPPPAAPAAAKPRPAPTPAAAPPSASTGAGYVAVISSQKTRMEALKKFADLQQKHDVLTGKTPDVQEADLSARGLGTMYRLVVGPPGSREAASVVCTQLRSAGQDCWVKEY
jgi:cell division septation protein DedD